MAVADTIDLDSIPDLVKKGDVGAVSKMGIDASKKKAEDAAKADTAEASAHETAISERNAINEKAKEPGGALAPLDLPTYKPPPPTDPWAVWGSPAMWLAGLSGLAGRRSLTRSLNAAGAVVSAVNQKDAATAKQKFDEWKQETDNAMKAHEWQRKAYEDALAGVKEDSKDREAIALTMAHATGDDATLKSIQEFGMAPTEKMWAERQKFAEQLQLQKPELEKWAMQKEAIYDVDTAQKEYATAKQKGDKAGMDAAIQKVHDASQKIQMISGKGGAASASGGLSEDAVDMDAFNRLMNGKYPPGLANKEDKEAIDNRAAAIAKDLGLSMAEAASLPAEKKTEAAALLQQTKWIAGVERGSSTVEKNMDLAEEYRKKLPFGALQVANQAMLEGLTEVGDPDAQSYLNLMNETALEYGRIMAGPTSNAMLPVSMAQQQIKRMGAALSPEQFESERKLMHRTMENQLSSTREGIDKIKGELRGVGGAVTHKKGDIIEHNNKKYRVLGGDPKDPDVEEITP